MLRNQVLAGIAGLAAGLVIPAIVGDAQDSKTTITCTNRVSGAAWQISIDYGKTTVDSNPAEIGRTAISWFDPRDGGNYRLDLASGHLTASVASSTGGYFRHADCSMDRMR